MSDKTNIEWCDATINCWIGCTKVSDACLNCYAEKLGRRFGVVWDAPPKRTGPASWNKIAAYQRGAARFMQKHGRQRRVFINSLSDFFDNQAEQAWRDSACIEMEAARDVVFILVTKRPQMVSRMVPKHWNRVGGWPRNVWLLATAEDQVEYDRRLAWLLTTRAPVIGLSIEPMLEIIDPGRSLSLSAAERAQWASARTKRQILPQDVNRLSWAIFGGESGRHARPMPPMSAVTALIDRFRGSKVAVFCKQMSQANHPDTFKDHSRFPPGFQRREHPDE